MNPFNRRTFLQGSTALGAAMALSGPALLEWAKAWAQAAPWKPEKGAKINLMRWRRFVRGRGRGLREDDQRLQGRRPASTWW